MRVSSNWLQEYVDCELTPAELADLLTMAGLEVEGIEEVGSELKGVVVAQIASITPPLPGRSTLSLPRYGGQEFLPYRLRCPKHERGGQGGLGSGGG